jgi:uncharacterized protein with ParB-like and HNH nuclease domain
VVKNLAERIGACYKSEGHLLVASPEGSTCTTTLKLLNATFNKGLEKNFSSYVYAPKIWSDFSSKESLNAKGRPLTQADLIRNYFLMKIPVNQQEDIYSKLWKPVQDKLETLENMTEYIRHFLMRDGYLVKKNEVYYTLIQKVGNQDVLEYLKELDRFSNFYSKLLKPANETNKEISKRLEILNRIEVTTAYPFLLNIYNDYSQQKINDKQFVQILDIIENFD